MPSLPTDIHGNKAYDIGSLAAKQHVSVHSSNGEANSELMRSCSPISAGHPRPKRSPRPKRLPRPKLAFAETTADHQSLFAIGASKRETLSITIELIELFTIVIALRFIPQIRRSYAHELKASKCKTAFRAYLSGLKGFVAKLRELRMKFSARKAFVAVIAIVAIVLFYLLRSAARPKFTFGTIT